MSNLKDSHNGKYGKMFVFEGSDGVGENTIIQKTKNNLIKDISLDIYKNRIVKHPKQVFGEKTYKNDKIKAIK